jgi:uncharacterized protein
MQIEQLWRYPVKSMQGESLPSVSVDEWGFIGDRQWAVIDIETGLALTARREPRLLFAEANLSEDDAVYISLPTGVVISSLASVAADAALSEWLGYSVALQRAGDAPATYEIAANFEDEEKSEWLQWQGPAGTFHDSTKTRVSFASSESMREWDHRRFRINVIVSGSLSYSMTEGALTAGGASFSIHKPIDRCVITTRAQPGGIERDLSVLKTIIAEMNNELGLGTMVESGGTLTVGDPVSLTP